jgi:hypothetical protein
VINFAVVDEEQPDIEVTEFDPPIEIEVRYTEADRKHAEKEGQPLSLAFWNGTVWERFTKEKHQFTLQPHDAPRRGGIATLVLRTWSDPPIGWGR